MTQNKFWDFVPGTATKPPELLLYGTISSQQSWWEDRVTPAQFNKELAALGEDVPEIVVRINSPGGDVFAANAIYTRLKDHGAKITVKVDGWAASAATIIAMAGDISADGNRGKTVFGSGSRNRPEQKHGISGKRCRNKSRRGSRGLPLLHASCRDKT